MGPILGNSPVDVCVICGDDITAGNETCDDGNIIPGDGCSATCQTEAGFTCTGTPSVCTTSCGDDITAGSETCDDGNIIPGDGCSATCQTEAGFECTGTPSVCTLLCGNGVVDTGEECDPPSAGICDLTCKFVTSSSGTVVGFTEVPRFCGLKQMAVVDSPVPPGDFAEVSLPLIFAETVDLQVSNEQTLRVANTGGGDAEVNADLTLLDTDGETTDWEDLLGATFDRSNTRQHHLASQPFSSMTPITNNPFIDVLLGQTAPESTFVDRFLKVRPNAGDAAFSAAGRDLITFTQVLRLEVSCDPAASCPDGVEPVNGECVTISCRSNADCDDGNLCTDDSCESAVCVFTSLGGASCNTGEPGVCAAGTEICQGGTLSCEPNVGPSTEICDGLDNDCDGAADETFDLGNDRLNCGTCGNVCEGVRGQCVGGVCEPLLSSGPAVICSCLGFIDNVFLCVDTCEPFPGGFCFDSGCSVDQSGQQQDFCDLVVECIRING